MTCASGSTVSRTLTYNDVLFESPQMMFMGIAIGDTQVNLYDTYVV
ncbi:putative DNA helicase [Salmonella phage 41]|nr:putative DNA helicase [Salmonella phage 41]